MSIDLAKFSGSVEAVVPILRGRGWYKGRRFQLRAPNGWYLASLGSRVQKLRRATPIEIRKATKNLETLRGYSYGAEIIPLNFSDVKFRYGFAESVPVHFLEAQPWTIVKCVNWHKEPIFIEVDRRASYKVLNEVRKRFEEERDLSELKGVTPELRYLYILHSLQRDNFRAGAALEKLKLAEAEREKRAEQFKQTFSQRIKSIIENAGGHLKQFYLRGESNLIVVWEVGGQTLKTLIDPDMKVQDLGYCTEDKKQSKHSLTSAVLLAETFQKEGSLFITRE